MASLAEVQAIPMAEAMICLDCQVIGNCLDSCPACGSSALWRVDRWIDAKVEQKGDGNGNG